MSGCHRMFDRRAALVAAVFFATICIPASAHAQVRTTFVAVGEHDTDAVNIGLIGVSFSPANLGWGWDAGITGYRLTYPGHGVWSVTPSAGIRNLMSAGEVAFKLGYNLVSDNTTTTIGAGFIPIVQTGSKKGVVGSFQGNYWGTGGPLGAELLSDVNFASKSTWDRGRLSTRIAQLNPGQIRLGGELVYMNGGGYNAMQAGPTIEWQSGSGVYITAAAGGKWPKYLSVSQKNAAYFALDFVWSPTSKPSAAARTTTP